LFFGGEGVLAMVAIMEVWEVPIAFISFSVFGGEEGGGTGLLKL
jgi:hypothetical protein